MTGRVVRGSPFAAPHRAIGMRVAAILAGAAAAVLAVSDPLVAATPGKAAEARAARRLAAQNAADRPRPRVIVASDVEIDDVASWHRFWLYANELDVAGLVYTSSRFHWAGDPQAGIAPLTWAGNDILEQQIRGYAAVYRTLRQHDPRYPPPGDLLGKVRLGNITAPGEMAKDTPGSKLVETVLLDDRPGPVHLLTWGGTNTFAAALRAIKHRYRETPQWPAVYRKVVAKARLYIVLDQDATYTEYVARVWPDLPTVYNYDQFLSVAYSFFRTTRTPAAIDQAYFGSGFMGRIAQGPLMQSYPLVRAQPPGPPPSDPQAEGGGNMPTDLALNLPTGGPQLRPKCPGGSFRTSQQAAPRQPGRDPAAPRPRPTPPEPGSFVSEGDSPSFWNVLTTGLRSDEDPGWGGWGGRFVRIGKALWTDRPDIRCSVEPRVSDSLPWASTPALAESAPQTRWIPALQNDFLARALWTTRSPAAANHEPVVRVARIDAARSVRPGETVTLSARAADPDGDPLESRWWQYREAGTYRGAVSAGQNAARIRDGEHRMSANVTIPVDARRGDTIHVILEVSDAGTPPLTRYGRFVLTVR